MKSLRITLLLAALVLIANVGNAQNTSKQKSSTSQPVEPEMVFVERGTFMMGCTSKQGNCSSWEKPAHWVTVDSFYIGKYEVTQAQWKAVMGNNPSHSKGDKLPVENVSWNEVQAFISKLNAQTGKQYRLPTEAEWEFAARGGNKSENYNYSGSNIAARVSWNTYNSGDKSRIVGTKSSNELGIHDMSGNVYEWCNDWYGNYGSEPQLNPQGPSSGEYRVARGGSWSDFAERACVWSRIFGAPDDRDISMGFRLACSSK